MTTNRKRQQLRNNEYYDFQETLDELYEMSKKGRKFTNLLSIITSKENVLLAYRNIKKNKGSKTRGTNRTTIVDIGKINPEELVLYVKKRLKNFKPHSVRRKMIEKDGGLGQRPLGIPTIEDRLIQQCIKQVLDPICEAKFYQHSYGFRANRSTHHALARTVNLINRGFHYVVDIDIKGFFDNVNHAKLLKQMWNLGIRDKNLLCIISKLLKAEIEGEGKPTKGTPQGGVLSPLLSNIVLNELDWWVCSQWENMKTELQYHNQSNKYRALNKSDLKQMFIVRYADDFKILCKDYKSAQKAFVATKMWLKERLNLEVSPDKSKVVNLRKNYSNFLGFKLKATPKRSKYVIKSHITDKAQKKIKRVLRGKIKELQKSPSPEMAMKYNATVLGIQNYYQKATHVYLDMKQISYELSETLKKRTSRIKSKNGKLSKTYLKYYGKYKRKIIFIEGHPLFPISGVNTSKPINFTQEICMYTKTGRALVHDKLKSISPKTLRYLMEHPVKGQSTEFNDNRISLYVGQNGLCAITKRPLVKGNMEVHHKIPRKDGGSDEYSNLLFVLGDIHKLIHATKEETVKKILEILSLNEIEKKKVNKLRLLVGNRELLAI
ncbi:group II intron reverse transcriptase/maturase [Bacillus sp. M6-12]|uniref:group II intron reverse transcriptase/maturase n=1 Tax=Bacillus sp. M6-12 TaxID=2054166 RepID=UPI000C789FD5|nr:group II intron reverse transcriptase/maturase [Bacillus sp. M6-12]PLS19439.1 group II intron reverse transcriptase/maturase [Bacillus sp. M6-12]